MQNFLKLRLLNLFSLSKTWNHASKVSILKWILFRTPILNSEYVLSNYGVWMKNNWRDKTFKLCIIGYRNGLEFHLKKILEDFTFFDIGANQGVFSMIAAKNKHCKNIHAFEPNSNLIEFLESNFLFNNLKNYTIHNFAISDKIKKGFLDVSDTHSGKGELTNRETPNEIQCINRAYINEIEDNNLIFAKIDVEGSEIHVLNELFGSKLGPRIKFIFIEIAQRYKKDHIIISLLLKNGFIEKQRHRGIKSYDALYIR